MKSGTLRILAAAHIGAQKQAKSQAEESLHDTGWVAKDGDWVQVPAGKAKLRKTTLEYLTEAGLPAFLLGSNDETMWEAPLLEPTAHGRHDSDPECGDSWTHWAVYSVAEYKAWCKHFEQEDLTDDSEDWDPDCKVCPDCGGYVKHSTRYSHTAYHCQECENSWQSKEERLEELAIQLTGWQSSYSGPGRQFNETPWAKVKRGRILVQQSGGYDV